MVREVTALAKKAGYVAVTAGIGLVALASACSGGGPDYSAKDISIDLWHDSGYCTDRYCPEPMRALSLLGGWTISFYIDSDHLVTSKNSVMTSQYYVEMKPSKPLNFTSVEELCCNENNGYYDYYIGFLDDSPVDALDKVINGVAIYKDSSGAKRHMDRVRSRDGGSAYNERPGPGEQLSGQDSAPLEILGYDDALINAELEGVSSPAMYTVWVRRGETVIEVRGLISGLIRDIRQDTAKRGVIEIAAMLLARADAPAESMTLAGSIYLDGQPLPTLEDLDGLTDDIESLTAFLGPYRIGHESFYSHLRYALELQGTRGMRGHEFRLRLWHGLTGQYYDSGEEITFQPGKDVQIDLHFESES